MKLKQVRRKIIAFALMLTMLLSFMAPMAVSAAAEARLPETGGIGRTIFYIGGAGLMVGTALFLMIYSKMNKKEKDEEEAESGVENSAADPIA